MTEPLLRIFCFFSFIKSANEYKTDRKHSNFLHLGSAGVGIFTFSHFV